MFGFASRCRPVFGAPAILCAVALVPQLSSRLAADEFDKKTIVTFSAPVEIPGKVLPAGTYVFKLLDNGSDRSIVQIFDKDEKQLYGTILGIPDYRPTPPDKPVVSFEERASNAPEAIKAWFYPGDNYGVQFVYTQDRATALAKRTHQNVLSMRNEMAADMSAPSRTASDANVQALEKADVTAVDPSGQTAALSTAVTSRPQ